VNIVTLDWQKPLKVGNYEVVRMSGSDEPIWVPKHICMETTQAISLCSYLHLKLPKMSCFSYSLSCFFPQQIRELEGRRSFAWRWRGGGGGLHNVYTVINVKMIK
jgi:hypothetical protein